MDAKQINSDKRFKTEDQVYVICEDNIKHEDDCEREDVADTVDRSEVIGRITI